MICLATGAVVDAVVGGGTMHDPATGFRLPASKAAMVGYPNRFADSGGGGVSLGYDDGGRFRKGGQTADDMEMTGLLGYQTVDGDHGRVETRTDDVIGGADWLDPQGKCGGLAAVGRVQSERIINKQESVEERFYIMSKRFSAEEFGKASRNHWGIENSLHWILDVAFDEDGCRIHAGYSAENFVVLRHIALHLLKQGTRIKRGIKTRRKVAGWDENYLLELLKGNFNA